jgi:hypothetical protein
MFQPTNIMRCISLPPKKQRQQAQSTQLTEEGLSLGILEGLMFGLLEALGIELGMTDTDGDEDG